MAEHDAEGRPSTYVVPSHADSATEHVEFDREIQYKQLIWLGVGLVIVAVISGVVVFFMLRGFVQWGDRTAGPAPVMEAAPQTMPGPKLLARPERERSRVRAAEDERLKAYGWIDQAGGVAHIPIERALEIAAQRGVAGLQTAPAAPNPSVAPTAASGGNRAVSESAAPGGTAQ